MVKALERSAIPPIDRGLPLQTPANSPATDPSENIPGRTDPKKLALIPKGDEHHGHTLFQKEALPQLLKQLEMASPEERQALLLQVLHGFAQEKNAAKVQETLNLLELSLPLIPTTTFDRTQFFAQIYLALKGTGLPQEKTVKQSASGLADGLVNPDASLADQMKQQILAREVFDLTGDTERVVQSTQQLRWMQSQATLKIKKAECAEKEKITLARLAVKIDQLTLPELIQRENLKPEEDREKISLNHGALERLTSYGELLARSEDLSFSDKLTEGIHLGQAYAQYRSLKNSMQVEVDSGSLALAQKNFLKLMNPLLEESFVQESGVPPEQVETAAAISNLLKDRFAQALASGEEAWLQQLSPQNILKFGETAQAAHVLEQDDEWKKALILYAQLGLTQKVKEILTPHLEEAQQIADPTGKVEKLMELSSLYQVAGLKEDANQIFKEIQRTAHSDFAPKILKNVSSLSYAFQLLNQGKIAEAEDVLKKLPPELLPPALQKKIRTQNQDKNLIGGIDMLGAVLRDYTLSITPEGQPPDLALEQSVQKVLGDTLQLVRSGEEKDFDEAFDRARKDSPFSTTLGIFMDGELGRRIFGFLNHLTGPNPNTHDIHRQAIRLVAKYNVRNYFNSVFVISNWVENQPDAPAKLKKAAKDFKEGIPSSAVLNHAFFAVQELIAMFSIAGNMLNTNIKMDQGFFTRAGLTIGTLGIARTVGIGAQALWVSRMKGVIANPVAMNLSTMGVRSVSEAAAFPMASMGFMAALNGNTDHITLGNYGTEFGAMLVMFTLLNLSGMGLNSAQVLSGQKLQAARAAVKKAHETGTGMARAQAQLKSAQRVYGGLHFGGTGWLTRVLAFTGSGYVNESLGLSHHEAGASFLARFVNSAVIDAQMRVGGKIIDAVSGGRLGRLERATHQALRRHAQDFGSQKNNPQETREIAQLLRELQEALSQEEVIEDGVLKIKKKGTEPGPDRSRPPSDPPGERSVRMEEDLNPLEEAEVQARLETLEEELSGLPKEERVAGIVEFLENLRESEFDREMKEEEYQAIKIGSSGLDYFVKTPRETDALDYASDTLNADMSHRFMETRIKLSILDGIERLIVQQKLKTAYVSQNNIHPDLPKNIRLRDYVQWVREGIQWRENRDYDQIEISRRNPHRSSGMVGLGLGLEESIASMDTTSLLGLIGGIATGVGLGYLGRKYYQSRAAKLQNLENLKRGNTPQGIPDRVDPSVEVVNDGPLGYSTREIINGVKVYTPFSDSRIHPEAKGLTGKNGTVLLISGSGGDHTSFGELPQRLGKQDWRVKTLVIPGYDRMDPIQLLDVGSAGARGLQEHWHLSLKGAVEELLRRNSEGPVILGGFSLGGAAATRILEGLDPKDRSRIQGMILAAPAFVPQAVDSPNPAKNFAIRKVALPAFSALASKPRMGRDPTWDPEIAKAIKLQKVRPWGMDYAVILFGEEGQKSLQRLQGQKNLPPLLLIYDTKDPTVSPRSADLARQTFPWVRRVVQMGDSDHYLFAFPGREKIFNDVEKFIRDPQGVKDELDTTPVNGKRISLVPGENGKPEDPSKAMGIGLLAFSGTDQPIAGANSLDTLGQVVVAAMASGMVLLLLNYRRYYQNGRRIPQGPGLSIPETLKASSAIIGMLNHYGYQDVTDPNIKPQLRARKLYALRNNFIGSFKDQPVLAEHFLTSLRSLIRDPYRGRTIFKRLASPESSLLDFQNPEFEHFFQSELHRAYQQSLRSLPPHSPELNRALELIPELLDRADGDRKSVALTLLMFADITEKLGKEDPQVQAVAKMFNEITSVDPFWKGEEKALGEAMNTRTYSPQEDIFDTWRIPLHEEDQRNLGLALEKFKGLVTQGVLRVPAPIPSQERVFGNLPFSEGPSMVNDRTLGFYKWETIQGVRVYSPLNLESPSTEGPPPGSRGTFLLIGGAGSDHTAFGEQPRRLQAQGWDVKILVIPGYDRHDHAKMLDVGYHDASKLEYYWNRNLGFAVEEILETNSEGPVMLGGFSLGGAAATRIYETLDPTLQKRIQGMVLIAPAYAALAMNTPNPARNWIARNLYVPGKAALSKKYLAIRDHGFAPEISQDVYLREERTWSSVLANTYFIEKTVESLNRLRGREDLPPVLLFYDRRDPTLSRKLAPMAQEAFGDRIVIQEVQDSDHYIFISPDRFDHFDKVEAFAESPEYFLNQGRNTPIPPKPDSGNGSSGAGRVLGAGMGLATLLGSDSSEAMTNLGRSIGENGGMDPLWMSLAVLGLGAMGMAFTSKKSTSGQAPSSSPSSVRPEPFGNPSLDRFTERLSMEGDHELVEKINSTLNAQKIPEADLSFPQKLSLILEQIDRERDLEVASRAQMNLSKELTDMGQYGKAREVLDLNNMDSMDASLALLHLTRALIKNETGDPKPLTSLILAIPDDHSRVTGWELLIRKYVEMGMTREAGEVISRDYSLKPGENSRREKGILKRALRSYMAATGQGEPIPLSQGSRNKKSVRKSR